MERLRGMEAKEKEGTKTPFNLLSDDDELSSRDEQGLNERELVDNSNTDEVEKDLEEVLGQGVFQKPDDKKPWVEVIKGNRLPSHGMSMEFVAPPVIDGEVEVEFEEEDVKQELIFWENAMIMFAVGKDLSMNAVKQFMMREWNFIALPELFYHDDGYFIVRCKEKGDREKVLANGPYMIFSCPVILKCWEAGFSMKDDLLRIVPVWVTFPKLPLHLWGRESLCKLASTIGKPIMTDECTAKKLRISYARVLIEIDITQNHKNEVTYKDVDGIRKTQEIVYERMPRFCKKCVKIGHDCEKIVKEKPKEKEMWIKKDSKWVPFKEDQQEKEEVGEIHKVVEKALPESSGGTEVITEVNSRRNDTDGDRRNGKGIQIGGRTEKQNDKVP